MALFKQFSPRTTTLPITLKDREDAAAFTPPKAVLGQPVIYYQSGTRGEGYPGVILENNFQLGPDGSSQIVNRNVKLCLANGSLVRACPHVDDPKLNWNYAIRSNGAWEIAPYETAKAAEINRLNAEGQELILKMGALYDETIKQLNALQKLLAERATTEKPTKSQAKQKANDEQ
jgi:hypothetical protein